MPTPLQELREHMRIRSGAIADVLGIHKTNFLKIEQGRSLPKHETARQIFELYGGVVPIGMIYDASHSSFDGWFTAERKEEATRLARRLRRKYPELRDAA